MRDPRDRKKTFFFNIIIIIPYLPTRTEILRYVCRYPGRGGRGARFLSRIRIRDVPDYLAQVLLATQCGIRFSLLEQEQRIT